MVICETVAFALAIYVPVNGADDVIHKNTQREDDHANDRVYYELQLIVAQHYLIVQE